MYKFYHKPGAIDNTDAFIYFLMPLKDCQNDILT